MEAQTSWPLSARVSPLKLPVSGCLDRYSLIIYYSTSVVDTGCLSMFWVKTRQTLPLFHCESVLELSDSLRPFAFLRRDSTWVKQLQNSHIQVIQLSDFLGFVSKTLTQHHRRVCLRNTMFLHVRRWWIQVSSARPVSQLCI